MAAVKAEAWRVQDGRIDGSLLVEPWVAAEIGASPIIHLVDGDVVFAIGEATQLTTCDGADGRVEFWLRADLQRLPGIKSVVQLAPRIGEILFEDTITLSWNTFGFAGYIDAIEALVVSGWAINLPFPAQVVSLDVIVNGEFVGSTIANLLRPDVMKNGLGTARCGFQFTLPNSLTGEAAISVVVVVSGTGIQLCNSPFAMQTLSAYTGYFDALHGPFAIGWVIDIADPERILRVEAVCDGQVIGSAVADRKRADVAAAGMPTQHCGFHLLIEASALALEGKEIEMRVADSHWVLTGSPKHILPNPLISSFHQRAAVVPSHVLPRLKRALAHRTRSVLISIIMPVFNTPQAWLEQALDSVGRQWNGNWELICVDDGSTAPHVRAMLSHAGQSDARIRLVFLDQNAGIACAVNAGLRAALGTHITFVDHDDVLEPDATHCLAQAILQTGAALIYSDEAVTSPDIDSVIEVRARPAFSYDYYLSHPYFVHLICVPIDLARQLGGFDETMAISADVDFVLRVLERAPEVAHVPRVLYRWRTHGKSTGHTRQAEANLATQQALRQHLARLGEDVTVSEGLGPNQFHIDWPDDGGEVLVVIPTRNRGDLLRACIDSIERTAPSENLRILVVNHESDDPETLRYLEEIAERHTVMPYFGPFNYAAINNAAIRQHAESAKYVLLLNNDVEAIEPGWIKRLRSLAGRPGIGAVGPLLLYSNRLIQHAGVLMAFSGAADHVMKFGRAYEPDGLRNSGYNCILTTVREYSAVTAACLMLRMDLFDAINGFDERFAVGFNDTDLCLRLGARGLRNLFDGHTVLFHHEHATRSDGSVAHPEDDARLREIWPEFFSLGDPYYSPWLRQHVTDHVLRDDASLPEYPPLRLVTRGASSTNLATLPSHLARSRRRWLKLPTQVAEIRPILPDPEPAMPIRIPMPDGQLLRTVATPGGQLTAPEIRGAASIPEELRAVLHSRWSAPQPDRVVEFHVLKDVYVVGEGLVFDRHLRLVDASVAQHEPEHLVAALASLRRCLSLDNVPTERSTTLLCGKIGMGNYGHWMVEMLPAAFLSRQLLIEGSWKVFMPRIYDHMAPIIHDSLSLLGLASEKCIVNDGAPYHFRELVFLSGLSEHGVFYPHAAVECMDALSSGIVPGTAERVWISREGERRSLRHEAAVSAALAERGWQIIRPGQMSLLEQIAVAKGARHIAGVNGAGLTNLGFMAPGGRVTSFMPSLMPDIFYWMLSALRRLDYCEVRCEVSPPCDWHIAWDAQINMPVEEVLAHLGV